MRALKLTIAAVLLAFAPVAASADGAHSQTKATAMVGEIHVSDGWVRAHLPNRPTAGYLSLKNTGDAADRLISASSPAFKTIEIHESRMEDGVMKMEPVTGVSIDAGATAVLEPGGYHLMMFGGSGLKEGDTVEVTMVFETAGSVTLTMPVSKRGPKKAHNH